MNWKAIDPKTLKAGDKVRVISLKGCFHKTVQGQIPFVGVEFDDGTNYHHEDNARIEKMTENKTETTNTAEAEEIAKLAEDPEALAAILAQFTKQSEAMTARLEALEAENDALKRQKVAPAPEGPYIAGDENCGFYEIAQSAKGNYYKPRWKFRGRLIDFLTKQGDHTARRVAHTDDGFKVINKTIISEYVTANDMCAILMFFEHVHGEPLPKCRDALYQAGVAYRVCREANETKND